MQISNFAIEYLHKTAMSVHTGPRFYLFSIYQNKTYLSDGRPQRWIFFQNFMLTLMLLQRVLFTMYVLFGTGEACGGGDGGGRGGGKRGGEGGRKEGERGDCHKFFNLRSEIVKTFREE